MAPIFLKRKKIYMTQIFAVAPHYLPLIKRSWPRNNIQHNIITQIPLSFKLDLHKPVSTTIHNYFTPNKIQTLPFFLKPKKEKNLFVFLSILWPFYTIHDLLSSRTIKYFAMSKVCSISRDWGLFEQVIPCNLVNASPFLASTISRWHEEVDASIDQVESKWHN